MTDIMKLRFEQDNCCAICKVSFSTDPSYVDFNKDTGIIRGLLCETCNLALACFDDSKILESAIEYLRKHEE